MWRHVVSGSDRKSSTAATIDASFSGSIVTSPLKVSMFTPVKEPT
jgi:hypothetical protein